jgi:23S rRNA (uracil1939-C5)-methyltransferase
MSKTPKPLNAYPKMPFVIESMDPLGQGVFKENGNIGFIAKTLPGETGTARLIKAKKGVKFARLESVDAPSPARITAECAHFNECPGCHYLHTSYDNELLFKEQSLAHLLQKLTASSDVLEVIPASQRLAYRNRIQLHYRDNKIGLIDGLTDTIVEIPHCKILREELKPELDKLYNKEWTKTHKKEGHCELYLKDDTFSLQWNTDYSHGGFTQVFDAMNERLCAEVNHFLQTHSPATLLDLFAGDGNLSNAYADKHPVRRIMIDTSPNAHPDFISMDLFAEGALKRFQPKCREKTFDTLLLDPPRKGFPEINAWVKQYRPKNLIYVSCNPATLARDLLSLKSSYSINKVLLMDLFPGTYHFETVVFLTFKKH